MQKIATCTATIRKVQPAGALSESSRESMQPVLHTFFPCLLHQTNIMVGATAKHINESLVSGMAAYSKLLRMGNYFVRTVLAVESVIDGSLDVVAGQAPLERQEYNRFSIVFSSPRRAEGRGRLQRPSSCDEMQPSVMSFV